MKQRPHGPRVLIDAIIATSTLLATLALASPTSAAVTSALTKPCADVEGIFARGSGDGLGAKEYVAFDGRLKIRLGEGVTLNTYELGSDEIDGHRYPAVNVLDIRNTNAIGAYFFSGYAFDYGNSVWDGVQELIGYVYSRELACPHSLFVFGGYSQGAQVIGQAEMYLDDRISSKVVFSAMFGDPKLYLPEGKGLRGHAPACRGEKLSPWRRTVPDCNVDNGSLGARVPYVGPLWESKTGLWCNNHDYVCGSSVLLWDYSGHLVYDTAGNGIDEAVEEIATRLEGRLPAGHVEVPPPPVATTTGQDVVFVIDSTGSMGSKIAAAKQNASTMASSITSAGGRVALVEYRDAGDPFVARTLSPLTSDVTAFQAQLATIQASGGGDTPEALLAALMQGFNSLDWRAGATKAAVVLTDAGFHNPDVAEGWTLEQVAARSLEIDPVNVYSVVPESLASTSDFQDLARLTSGAVITDTGDTVASLTEALTRIITRPVAHLPLASYSAAPGQSITFDASSSRGVGADIASYAFDFDGDGTFEVDGPAAIVKHVYDAPFDGAMQVRVTAADGGVGTFSAHVLVSSEPVSNGAPLAPTAVTVTPQAGDGTVATLTWTPADALASRWAVSVNGIMVGISAADQTTVTITDLDRASDIEFSVAGVASDDAVGDSSTAILTSASTSPPPASSTPPLPQPSSAPTPTQPASDPPNSTLPTLPSDAATSQPTADVPASLPTDSPRLPVALPQNPDAGSPPVIPVFPGGSVKSPQVATTAAPVIPAVAQPATSNESPPGVLILLLPLAGVAVLAAATAGTVWVRRRRT